MRLIAIFLGVIFFLSACGNLENENIIPEDAMRLDELQQAYQDILVSNEDGWMIEYQPGDEYPSVAVLMYFEEDNMVRMISDRLDFSDEQTSTYRINGVIGPELVFDTYSVWSEIAETGGGAFDFRMTLSENGDFILKHASGGNDRTFSLKKASPSDRSDIESRAEVGRLLNDFSQNSSAYFRNLRLSEINAFWEMDIHAQKLSLTWEIGSEGATQSETFSYTTLPGNGIRLNEAWDAPGGLRVQEFFFGSASPDALEITQAGNAGNGQIEVAHVPAFPYPDAAKRFMLGNSFNPNQDPVRFFGYIPGTREESRDRFSDALWPYYEKLWTVVWPEFIRLQAYNFNPVTNPSNSIQLLGRVNDANTWMVYYYAMDEMDGSHVLTRKRNEVDSSHPHYNSTYTSGNSLALYDAHPALGEFLDRIYPAEGVTIVPLSGQHVRVVSRVNSLYYMDLQISSPSSFWTN